ncbi:MAG: histidine kinase dimerization/phospho-acceptor domain-containing protein [Leptolyngbyaceae cyanobacterium bins.349]|nr:histidine kinase dimerization/phospho-acceptor domain-containing protein [Leptolyngbyaceae cyanobacterium bins.349]
MRFILVAPFVLQLGAAVGIISWLSLRNGQAAIADLATQLSDQVSNRVSQQLHYYLATPRLVNETNLQAMQLGMLNPYNLDTTRRFFWKQMQLSQSLSYINFGCQRGTFIGVGRENDGSLYTELMQPRDRFRYQRYALDPNGNPTRLLTTQTYRFDQDEWYKSAATQGKPLWSPIYQWQDRPEIISISSSYPVYDQSRRLVGVLGIDLTLSHISDFLRSLQISPSGKIFVMERHGLIVASSSQEKPYRTVQQQVERLNALHSQEPLVREVAHQLRDRFTSFARISTTQHLSLPLGQERAFVTVMPWQDAMGLDWLIVVVIPEADFMAQIEANRRVTLLLCLLALAVAILVGLITSRLLTQPIRQLAAASRAIAHGHLEQPLQRTSIDELAQLSQSFNDMAAQLQSSFTELEERVAQRTAELVQAKTAAEAASAAKSDFLAQMSHELRTPLNAIIGFAQMMQDDPALSDTHQNQIAIMHRNANELLSLINNILRVSRLPNREYQEQHLDHTLAQRSPPDPATFTSASLPLDYYLKQMPPAWIEQLYQAAVKGSDSDILQLIDDIPPACTPLADILKNWIKDFHFDPIIHLIHHHQS